MLPDSKVGSAEIPGSPASKPAGAEDEGSCIVPETPTTNHALANPCATALDQNDQYNDKEYASSNSYNRDIIHVNSPFS